MNTKRILFWFGFLIILGLIIWGLVESMNRSVSPNSKVGTPSPVISTDHIKVAASSTETITIVEYSDFQCPACQAFYPVIDKLMTDASTSQMIRLVYRHYPLPQHANAMIAAQAAEAASLQGKFWPMYDKLFSFHTDWTELPDPKNVFYEYATEIGLNLATFKKDLESDAVKAVIEKEKQEAQDIGVSYTPSFFVNGKLIENPQGYEQFKTLLLSIANGSKK